MALTKCDVPTDVIGSLGTSPEERGLTTQEFKDKFDETSKGIKDYLNNTLTAEIDSHLAESVSDVGGVHGLEMESGTWTPTVSSETTVPTTLSYVVQRGTYDRIGNIVKCTFFIRFTLTDGDGDINIGNFPFIVKVIDETGNLYRFTLAGVKQENTGVVSVSTNINYFKIANGQSFATINSLTNGSQVDISGSVIYRLV